MRVQSPCVRVYCSFFSCRYLQGFDPLDLINDLYLFFAVIFVNKYFAFHKFFSSLFSHLISCHVLLSNKLINWHTQTFNVIVIAKRTKSNQLYQSSLIWFVRCTNGCISWTTDTIYAWSNGCVWSYLYRSFDGFTVSQLAFFFNFKLEQQFEYTFFNTSNFLLNRCTADVILHLLIYRFSAVLC